MKTELSITASSRTLFGKKVADMRKSGKIPAVLYGHGVKTLPLVLDRKAFATLYAKSGENTLVELAVDSEKPKTVLVHDVQHHFLTDELIHVDFYEVKMTEKIKAKVPIVFVSEAQAVKDLGGVLVKNLIEVEVESLPADLPHSFEVDISRLKTFEDTITVADLAVDVSKVRIIAKPEEVITKVTPPRSEEELKSLEEKPVEEVSAVEGVVKETPTEDATEPKEIKETKPKDEKA